MEVLLIIVFAASALLVSAVILAVIVASIRREERHMSLKDAPATRVEADVRRLLGAGVRQPQDRTRITQADRRMSGVPPGLFARRHRSGALVEDDHQSRCRKCSARAR